MADRVTRDPASGANLMNCQMCKYREQVLGFEADVGRPQESHHHHVEGLGADAECKLCADVCTELRTGTEAGSIGPSPPPS